MTDDQIKHMVDRFLAWRLPEDFNPDDGISFKPMFNEHTAHPMRCEPTGTNLFDATQAEAMIRYMLEDLPTAGTTDDRCLNFHPFEGDRDSNTTLLSDRMVVGRKAHRCQICWGPIAAAERHRARTERDNTGKVVRTFRFCGVCCEAMVKALYNPNDCGRAIEARTAMGMKASGVWPAAA